MIITEQSLIMAHVIIKQTSQDTSFEICVFKKFFFLYRSIQEHAVKIFPRNVESRTIHSLAFRGVGHRLVTCRQSVSF